MKGDAVELEVDRAQLAALERELTSQILQAGTGAVHDATRKLERELEALTRAAVPGRAWRAWRSVVYPRGGGPAYEPVGIILANGGPRSEGMLEYWSLPGLNRAKHGKYLAAPLAAALGTAMGRNIGPRAWEGTFHAKLRPLFRPGKTPLLVADGAIDGNGHFVAAKKAEAKIRGGQKLTRRHTVAVFALIDVQPFANRVSRGPAIARAHDYMITSFQRRLARVGKD